GYVTGNPSKPPQYLCCQWTHVLLSAVHETGRPTHVLLILVHEAGRLQQAALQARNSRAYGSLHGGRGEKGEMGGEHEAGKGRE
ncbi:unnamed protein product, partial [Closterium sp. Naga37s-1]